ncbi:MAG TPA: cytochrome c oxidase assembly protein, partial [Thermomicrobiales bacterium]|nr:cytochrome c oxidase assembly protein [Thermomicrobiales bacterium]
MRHILRSGPHRRDLMATLGAVTVALAPAPALAHTSDAVAPAELLHHWQPDPLVVFGLLLAGWLYARGAGRLGRVADAANRPHPLPLGRRAAFWLGLATILLALASPLDTATATLFTAHMVQHVLL